MAQAKVQMSREGQRLKIMHRGKVQRSRVMDQQYVAILLTTCKPLLHHPQVHNEQHYNIIGTHANP